MYVNINLVLIFLQYAKLEGCQQKHLEYVLRSIRLIGIDLLPYNLVKIDILFI